MDLTIGAELNGFRLQKISDVAEVNAKTYEFEHVKTGAKLFYLAADDDNKAFYIAFRTPPEDDTGVAHIIEHSVLCGSKKYPLKEPFVELVKGSLNTFLNAMTYPDKTVYPVASRNAKDFRNLQDVYLDAVFYPNLLTTPEILMQEGWHYEAIRNEELGIGNDEDNNNSKFLIPNSKLLFTRRGKFFCRQEIFRTP